MVKFLPRRWSCVQVTTYAKFPENCRRCSPCRAYRSICCATRHRRAAFPSPATDRQHTDRCQNCCSFMVFSPSRGASVKRGWFSRFRCCRDSHSVACADINGHTLMSGIEAARTSHSHFPYPQFSHAPASSARRFLCCFDTEIMKIVSRFFILFPYFVRHPYQVWPPTDCKSPPIVVITVLRDGLGLACSQCLLEPTAKGNCGAPDLHSRPCARDARIKPGSVGRLPGNTPAPRLASGTA